MAGSGGGGGKRRPWRKGGRSPSLPTLVFCDFLWAFTPPLLLLPIQTLTLFCLVESSHHPTSHLSSHSSHLEGEQGVDWRTGGGNRQMTHRPGQWRLPHTISPCLFSLSPTYLHVSVFHISHLSIFHIMYISYINYTTIPTLCSHSSPIRSLTSTLNMGQDVWFG